MTERVYRYFELNGEQQMKEKKHTNWVTKTLVAVFESQSQQKLVGPDGRLGF